MSAPDRDLETQTRRHRGPLRGMFAVVLFALVLLAILGFWAFGRGGTPQGAETQIQTGIGEVESGEVRDGVSANNLPDEEEVGAGTEVVADPTAVTVPAETVTVVDTGAGNPADTEPGESQSAEPLDPVSDEADEDEGLVGATEDELEAN